MRGVIPLSNRPFPSFYHVYFPEPSSPSLLLFPSCASVEDRIQRSRNGWALGIWICGGRGAGAGGLCVSCIRRCRPPSRGCAGIAGSAAVRAASAACDFGGASGRGCQARPWLLEPARTARAPKRCHTALCASALGPLPHASAPRRGPRRWGESNTKAWISDLADVIHARLALLKLEYLPALSKAAGGAPAATAAGESPAVGGSSSQRAASGRHVALLLALAAAAGGLYAVQRVGYDNAVKAVSEVRSAPWRAIRSRRGLLRPPSLRRGGRAAPPPRRPPPR